MQHLTFFDLIYPEGKSIYRVNRLSYQTLSLDEKVLGYLQLVDHVLNGVSMVCFKYKYKSKENLVLPKQVQ